MSTMALALGTALPQELTVLDSEGRRVGLPVRRGEAALLVFMRHLG